MSRFCKSKMENETGVRANIRDKSSVVHICSWQAKAEPNLKPLSSPLGDST